MDSRSPGFLGDTGNEFFHLFADNHHHVGEFVNYHHNAGQLFQTRRGLLLVSFGKNRIGGPQRISDRRACFLGVYYLAVVPTQVAYAQRCHQFIATFHLRHAPAQSISSIFHVRNDRRQQMRDTVVNRKFQHLWVYQDKANVLWA